MREIKFRAVIKATNEVFHVITIWSNSVCLDLSSSDKYEWDEKVLLMDEVEMQQYTGLHDKNGREIYEGDILKDFSDNIGQVIWGDREACFTVIGCNDYGDFANNLGKGCVPTSVWFEVIGNIYDNPELLKECD